MIPHGAIVLIKNLAIVGDAGQAWNTDWVRFPSGIQNAQYMVEVKSIDVGKAVTFDLLTAYDFDTTFSVLVASLGPLAAIGMFGFNVISGMGQLVRLRITTNFPGTFMGASAWVLPKKN